MSLKLNRKEHPNQTDYEIIEFEDNGVRHQIVVKRGLSDDEVLKEIEKYLYGYETEIVNEKGEKVKVHIKGYYDFYPKTKKVG